VILAGERLQEVARKAISPEPIPKDFGQMSVDVHARTPEPRTIIESGEHLVIPAAEHVSIPTDVGAMITGRSTHMRQGLFSPAGWLDPGFESTDDDPLKLEFGNTSDGAAVLTQEEPAARLTFFELSCDTEGYDGQYGADQ